MSDYQATAQTWNKLAFVYQEKFMNLDTYNDTYDTFCSLITPPDAKLLEIGCGPGNITKYVLSKNPDCKIEAIDVAPNMIELARANNPAASFRVMDCRAISSLACKYDGIICGFCLPYLSQKDGFKLIRDCATLLEPGGILYISWIEGAYEHSGYETGSTGDQIYVYYYPEAHLLEILNANEFTLLKCWRKAYIKSDGKATTQLIFIASKV